MKEEAGFVNLITSYTVDFCSPKKATLVGTYKWHTGVSNGLSGVGTRWQLWEQWCVAFDMEAGQTISYVDGLEDGEQVI